MEDPAIVISNIRAQSDSEPAASARWTILYLTCAGLFGQFYALDIPAAVNEQFQEAIVGPSGIAAQQYDYYFSLLYSVYSIPNVVLPLILGIAVDRCGCGTLILLLALCVLAGQVVFTFGFWTASWRIMLLGRALFGLGGESLQVAQGTLLFNWFKGKEVGFALGLNLSVGRAGSVLNDVLTPRFAQAHGIVGALILGGILCFASFCCNVLSVIADRRASVGQVANDAGDDVVGLKDVIRMPRLFWLLATYCVIVYCGILPFNNIASPFFVETAYSDLPKEDAQRMAGLAMSNLFLVSAIGTPAFGRLVDEVGKRTVFLVMSAILLTVTHSALFFLPPMMSMLCLGLVYMAFAGALWPAFGLAVEQKQLGTAYGVACALQNAGLAVAPLLVGRLQSANAMSSTSTSHFKPVIELFICFGLAGIVCSIMILRENRRGKGLLDMPSLEAEKSQERGERAKLYADSGARRRRD